MKNKLFMNAMLIVESALVLITLLMGKNSWLGIVCYWAVLLMKNIRTSSTKRGRRHDGGDRCALR